MLSAADVKSNPFVIHLMGPTARFVNKLGGNFRWQHLPVPFEVYADGIDLVIFEEFGSGAAALHLKEEVARNELLRDETYRRRFRKDYENKYGPRVWHRDFFDAQIVECPDKSLVGKSFGQVGRERGGHPVDAFLDLVVEYGTRCAGARRSPTTARTCSRNWRTGPRHPDGLFRRRSSPAQHGVLQLRACGFSVTCATREKTGPPFMSVEYAVHRLTGELADWYQIDAGHLRVGDRADVVVIDPERLDASLDDYAEEKVDQYAGLSRMVNRNDDTVAAVLVAGRAVFLDGRATDIVGRQRTGSFLQAGTASAAPATSRDQIPAAV